MVEKLYEPALISRVSANGPRKMLFTAHSSDELRNIKKHKHNRLDQLSIHNHLLTLPKASVSWALSVLNRGMLFDPELDFVWRLLMGQ